MEKTEISRRARVLNEAIHARKELERFTAKDPGFSLASAYMVQDEGIALLQAGGHRVVGYKMGLTSQAKMKQMGVSSPIYGVLTDRMKLESGAELALEHFIHPKIEPEVAFIIGRKLQGKVDAQGALAACSGVCAAMEVIDSRYLNFNFELADVIADNCSSSAFVLGPVVKKPTEVDLGNLGMVLEVNGRAVQFGSSSAIYGHPAASLAELCNMLIDRGRFLPPGSIVLAGAATQAVALEPGAEVRALVQDLGEVRLKVKGGVQA